MLPVWRKIAVVALLALIPASILAYRHSKNQRYPGHDNAYYFISAYSAYDALKHGDVTEAVRRFYRERNQVKPILVPALAIPFLGLTGGDVLKSQEFATVSLLVALVAYLYLALGTLLPPLPAAAGTALITTMPFILDSACVFESELPMLVALAATFYHGVRSNRLTRAGQATAAAFALGLAICFRPIEVTGLCLVPIALLFREARIRSWIERRDVFAAAAGLTVLFATAAWLCAGQIKFPESLPSVVPPLGFAATIFLFRSRLRLSSAVTAALLAFVIPVAGWILPSASHFFYWGYQTAFGPIGPQVRGRSLVDPITFLFERLGNVGSHQFAALMVIASLGIAFKRVRDSKPTPGSASVMLSLAWMIALPFAIGTIGQVEIERYYYAGAFVALFAGTVAALHPTLLRSRARLIAIVPLILLNLAYAGVTVLAPDSRLRHQIGDISGGKPWLLHTNRGEDRVAPIHLELRKIFPADRPLKIALSPLYPGGSAVSEFIEPLDGGLLTLLSMTRGLAWRFALIRDANPEIDTLPDLLRVLSKKFDYVVVGPVSDAVPAPGPVHLPAQAARAMVDAWQSGRLAELGFRHVGDVPLKGWKDDTVRGLVLQSTPKQPISAVNTGLDAD